MDRLSQTMVRWWQNGNIVFANGILLMHKIKQMFGGLLKQVLLSIPVMPISIPRFADGSPLRRGPNV